MRLKGGRTGVRAVTCEGLELTGLMNVPGCSVQWIQERELHGFLPEIARGSACRAGTRSP
ncbi:hypothetical protein SCANM63S_07325 [Streptomyces canarius]